MKRSTLGTDLGLFILRVTFGAYMLFAHGMPKLSAFAEKAAVFPDPLGIGSKASLIAALVAEVGCSVLLILGLGTRLAALVLAFTMLIAAFVVHAQDPWKVRELAVVYLTVYAVIFLCSAGKFSLDRLFWVRERDEDDLLG